MTPEGEEQERREAMRVRYVMQGLRALTRASLRADWRRRRAQFGVLLMGAIMQLYLAIHFVAAWERDGGAADAICGLACALACIVAADAGQRILARWLRGAYLLLLLSVALRRIALDNKV